MRTLFIALAGLLIGTAAMAQPVSPPPAPGANAPAVPMPAPMRDDEPPPSPDKPLGPHGDRPPPLHGAAFMINRGTTGEIRLDVHCAGRDTTKDCADITAQMLENVSVGEKSKKITIP